MHDNDNDDNGDSDDGDNNDDDNDRSGCNRVHEWNPIFAAVINHKPSSSG